MTIKMVSAFKPSVTPVGLLRVVWGAPDVLAEFGKWGNAGVAVSWPRTGPLRGLTCVVFLLLVDFAACLGVLRWVG